VATVRILVTGSRFWDDADSLMKALSDIVWQVDSRKVAIVHGGCPSGADAIAGQTARALGLTVEVHPADWDTHGRAAGPIRNQEMVSLGADVVLAFFRKDAANRGTSDCVARAVKAGIEVRRFWQ